MIKFPDDILTKYSSPLVGFGLVYVIANTDKDGVFGKTIRQMAGDLNIKKNVAEKILLELKDDIGLYIEGRTISRTKIVRNIGNFRALRGQSHGQNSDAYPFEKLWEMYGNKKGNKSTARTRYNKLSDNVKKDIFDYIPYYNAFCEPRYIQMLTTFLNKETWKSQLYFNGIPIPKEKGKYHVADVDSFKAWFNRQVEGTLIPKVVEVTPDRRVNLNICYTLYPKLMNPAMKIVTTSKYYQEMGDKISFDYIFNPANLIKICERGGNING